MPTPLRLRPGNPSFLPGRCRRRLRPWRTLVLLGLGGLLLGGLLVASAPSGAGRAADQATLIIRHGGTYTGTYRSLDAAQPCVSIETTEPVTLRGCLLVGPGDLIRATAGEANLTVVDCRGYGQAPVEVGGRRGRFVEVNSAHSLVVEHNYFEHTSGILVYLWGGNGTAQQTLRVRYNQALDIDGRLTGGGVAYVQFLQLNGALGLVGAEVAWNQVVNEPNNSLVEDNINLYNSSGTAQSPFVLHDNYIQGAYPYPATAPSYTGSGITVDGAAQTASGAAAWFSVYNNQLVSTCAALNIAAGHDNHFYDNRVVHSALLPDGQRLQAGYSALGLWNAYGQAPGVFYNNDMRNNTVGFYYAGGNSPYLNRHDIGPGACSDCLPITSLPDRPLTLADEQAEWSRWQQKLLQNGIVPGPTTAATTSPTPTPTPAR